LRQWCVKGYEFLKSYDKILSLSMEINPSIKITSVKPSGTVSILAGSTPGVHYP
jgi:ribonucleoside-triphosphate reductase (thioredoxin)